MKKIWLYGVVLICGIAGCTRESDWERQADGTEKLRKVNVQMAVEEGKAFEENIHSLAVYAFRQVDDGTFVYYKRVADLTTEDIHDLGTGMFPGYDSKVLKVILPAGLYRFYYLANDMTNSYVEPLTGEKMEQGYLPFPLNGMERPYFMGEVEMKPGASENTPLLVVLSRVVSRLTMVITGIPDSVDTVHYRIGGIASRVLLTGAVTRDTTSYMGDYPIEAKVADDTVISGLLLFPSSRAEIAFRFMAEDTVVKEKTIPVSGLIPDNDIYISGYWDEVSVTKPVRTFSILSCSNFRSSD